MKKFFLTAIFAGLMIFITEHQARAQEIIGLAEPGSYEYTLAKGLKQFPYPSANGFYTVAVASHLSEECKSKLTDQDQYAVCAVLRVVTREKLVLKVEVVGMLWQMIPFLHELAPQFGQYRWWHSVVWLDKSPSGQHKYYYWHQFNMLGRFRAKSKENGEFAGYKNEIYR